MEMKEKNYASHGEKLDGKLHTDDEKGLCDASGNSSTQTLRNARRGGLSRKGRQLKKREEKSGSKRGPAGGGDILRTRENLRSLRHRMYATGSAKRKSCLGCRKTVSGSRGGQGRGGGRKLKGGSIGEGKRRAIK